MLIPLFILAAVVNGTKINDVFDGFDRQLTGFILVEFRNLKNVKGLVV